MNQEQTETLSTQQTLFALLHYSPQHPNEKLTDEAVIFMLKDLLDFPERIRPRAKALSTMAQDIAQEHRRELVRALIILMWRHHKPKQPAPRDERGDIEYSRFRVATPEFVALAAPIPGSAWDDHVEAKYNDNQVIPEYVKISPYFAETIELLEDLFDVAGTQVDR